MAEVVLDKAGKTYPGGVRAVEGFDLEIADGEFVVLVGPSGCGKSTTLRMIAGLEEITEGSISIAGTVVNDVHARDRDIAMVFQDYALYPHMTVEWNLSFGLCVDAYSQSVACCFQATIARRCSRSPPRSPQGLDLFDAGHPDLLDRQPRALSEGSASASPRSSLVRAPQVFLRRAPLEPRCQVEVEMRTELRVLHRQLSVTMICGRTTRRR